MVKKNKELITIDLNQFKLHINVKQKMELSLHFNSRSRNFYLSVIAFVVKEMKKIGRVTSIPLEKYHDVLALLNETVGGNAGSSKRENLLPRIYRKWKHALPDLEQAPLFKVLGRKKEYNEGIGKTYRFTKEEEDSWANLFEYKGSEENVRLRFSIDKLGVSLNDVVITYGEDPNLVDASAWKRFFENLKQNSGNASRILMEPKHESQTKRGRTIENAQAFDLPDKPSIAILPFINLSEDPSQEYFSDGLTEDILTALSKIPRLFVIARSSVFTFKGKSVKVQQVAKDLGVQYILEGSIRRSGNRVRITVQLANATTGHYMWAERYDRELKDVFTLQDEIVQKILTSLELTLTEGEQALVWRKSTTNPEAYEKHLKALECFRCMNEDANLQARKLWEEAIDLDSEYAVAYNSLSWTHLQDVTYGWSTSPEGSMAIAEDLAQKAVALDNSLADVHALMANIYLRKGRYEDAIAEGERAVDLNPNLADVTSLLGLIFRYAGKYGESIHFIKKGIRLNPIPPNWYLLNLGHLYVMIGQYEEAIGIFNKILNRDADLFPALLGLTAAYSEAGQDAEARAGAEEVLRANPKFSLENYAKALPYRNQADLKRYIDALRHAGLK